MTITCGSLNPTDTGNVFCQGHPGTILCSSVSIGCDNKLEIQVVSIAEISILYQNPDLHTILYIYSPSDLIFNRACGCRSV